MTGRLFWHVVSIEARRRMSYRADFWINAIVSLAVQIGISIFLVHAIFRESGQAVVAGFTYRGMLLYFVTVAFLGKLVRATEMEFAVSSDIYEGGLTRYLLYPSSYPVFKYAQQLGALAPVIVQVLLLGVWIPFVMGIPDEMRISIGSVAMCAVALGLANILLYVMTLPIQAVAFWADNVWSLMVANRIIAALLGGMTIPLALYPEWAQQILNHLPFRFLFAFPVDALLGRLTPAQWAVGALESLGWCLAFAVIGRVVWKRGDLQYTGVGI